MTQQKLTSADVLQANKALVDGVYRLYKDGVKDLPEDLRNQMNSALENAEFRAAILAMVMPAVISKEENVSLLILFLGKKANRYVHLARSWKILASEIKYEVKLFDRGSAAFSVRKGKELLKELEAQLTGLQEKRKSTDSWMEQKQIDTDIEKTSRQVNALKANIPLVEDWLARKGSFDQDPTKRPGYNQPRQQQTDQQRQQDVGAANAVANLGKKQEDAPTPLTFEKEVQELEGRIAQLQQEAEAFRQNNDRKSALAKDTEAVKLEEELLQMRALHNSLENQTTTQQSVVEQLQEQPAVEPVAEVAHEQTEQPLELEEAEAPTDEVVVEAAEPEEVLVDEVVQTAPVSVEATSELTMESVQQQIEEANLGEATTKSLLKKLQEAGPGEAHQKLVNILNMR